MQNRGPQMLQLNIVRRGRGRAISDDPTPASTQIGHAPDRAAATKEQRRWMTNQLPENLTGLDILDLGTGMGFWPWEVFMAPRFDGSVPNSMVGVDICRDSLRYARRLVRHVPEKSRIKFRYADLERRLRFPMRSFDVVGGCRSMNYLHNKAAVRLIRKIGRMIRPGGHILLVDICTDPDPELTENVRQQLIVNPQTSLDGWRQAQALRGYQKPGRSEKWWRGMIELLSPPNGFTMERISSDPLSADWAIHVRM